MRIGLIIINSEELARSFRTRRGVLWVEAAAGGGGGGARPAAGLAASLCRARYTRLRNAHAWLGAALRRCLSFPCPRCLSPATGRKVPRAAAGALPARSGTLLPVSPHPQLREGGVAPRPPKLRRGRGTAGAVSHQVAR